MSIVKPFRLCERKYTGYGVEAKKKRGKPERLSPMFAVVCPPIDNVSLIVCNLFRFRLTFRCLRQPRRVGIIP